VIKRVLPYFGLLGALTLTGTALGVPTATYVKSIDISGASNFPTGLDVYNGDVYYVSFNDRKLVKIANPLTASPTISTLHDFTSDATWVASRGMIGCNVDQATGNVAVNGENGTIGVIGVYSSTGSQIYLSNSTSPVTPRYTAMDRYGTTSTVYAATLLASSIMRMIDISTNPPTERAQTAAAAAPYNSNFRDCKVVGERVYYSRNGTTADGYARYDSFTTTPNTLAGALATGIYQTTGTNAVSAMGIGYWNDGGTPYVLVPDVSGKNVKFVNATTNAVALTVDHPVFVTGGLRDATVANVGPNTYLFVTHAGATPPAGDSIEVFQLSNTAGVNDWALY
jgi:hypothetical protein